MFLYNDYHSCETVWPHGLCNAARNLKEIAKHPQRIIQGVGGGLQIVSSVIIDWTAMTPAQEAYALALFGHGMNNMQEAWTGKNGYLKEYAYEPIFGKYANSVYSVVDLGLSGYGMIRVTGVREIENSYNYISESYTYEFGYHEMSKATFSFELINDATTVYTTWGN